MGSLPEQRLVIEPRRRQKITQLAFEIILAREFSRLRPSFWLRRAPNSAVAQDKFWRIRYRVEEIKAPNSAQSFYWVQGRGATWTKIRVGGEMWFNLPLLHTSDTSAWKRSWKSRRSFLCFISRLKIKNIQRKRSSACLYYSSRYFRCWKLHHLDHGGIFHGILNMCHNLSKNNKKQSLKESTREKKGAGQRRKVTGEYNTSFPQSGKCFCKILPTAKTYFLFWLKK